MCKTYKILTMALLSLGCLVLNGCSSLQCVKTGGDNISATTDFPLETARLEQIAEGDADASVRARAHLQLARIYSDYRNPDIDYSLALRQLEAYMEESSDGEDSDDIQNWLAVLQELENTDNELKKSETHVGALTKENAGTKEALEQSEKKNKEMKEIIEKLQSIDIQIEEKRKNIK